MATRNRQGRIAQILESLQTGRAATIQELSQRLSVSEMTIRRDLTLLAAQNKVRLVRAGAVLRSGFLDAPQGAYSLASDQGPRAEERVRIGTKAASLVEPGDVVIIDSGSTTEWLARSLPSDMPLTVICFALNILLEVGSRENCTVVFAGGTLQSDTLVCESAEGIQLIRRYRANKAFLSAGGVSDSLGVTCVDAAEAELKKAAMQSAQSKILLADSSKLGRVTPSWFAAISDFDAMVTDPGISLEYVEIARSRGIALHIA
ncbi:MAG: DeoR/GlpR family DNA-binding transcription regulator [Spirochaetia bacterium]|jgi:DeoR family deoxyribose operon repressor